ncbi:hypothetical protein FF1_035619 [Malus domestica]
MPGMPGTRKMPGMPGLENDDWEVYRSRSTTKRDGLGSPHTTPILEGVRPTFERAIEVAMDLVLAIRTLINECQFEESSDVGALGGEGYEDGDVSGVILRIFTIRVKIDGPLKPPDGEILTGGAASFADNEVAREFGVAVLSTLKRRKVRIHWRIHCHYLDWKLQQW